MQAQLSGWPRRPVRARARARARVKARVGEVGTMVGVRVWVGLGPVLDVWLESGAWMWVRIRIN